MKREVVLVSTHGDRDPPFQSRMDYQNVRQGNIATLLALKKGFPKREHGMGMVRGGASLDELGVRMLSSAVSIS